MEAEAVCRLGMYICWPWAIQRLPYNQCALLFSISSLLILYSDLYVPPEQVIDTVDRYFIKHRQRRLSLHFLTWFLLKKNIQEDTHDSIEDARCALMSIRPDRLKLPHFTTILHQCKVHTAQLCSRLINQRHQ